MSTRFLSKSWIVGISISILVFAGIAGYVWKEQHRPHVLEIYVFNLKTGRSVFVRTPNDQRILVNGGGNSDVIRELTGIIPFYSRRIDTVIATDADGKDVSGLIDVLNRYHVSRVFVSAITLQNLGIASSTDDIYETFLQTVKKSGVRYTELSAGDHVDLDVGVRADVIFPVKPDGFSYSKASSPEIVMNIVYASTTIGLYGSISKKVQNYLLATGEIGVTDVLAVSQSFGAGNVSESFIKAVKPTYLLYSKTIAKNDSVTKSGESSKSSKKVIADPLNFISPEDRFNLKEKGTVHIVSDGKTMLVK